MTFRSGTSGNPKGRPKGSGSRQQLFNTLVEPYREELFTTAINMALDGNEAMLRLFLDRMLPAKPVDEPIEIEIASDEGSYLEIISSMGKEALHAVTTGQITPEQAGKISSLLGSNARSIALIDFDQRLKVLEKS